MKKIGLEANLFRLGVVFEEDFDLIINNVNTERLSNNPRIVTEEDLIKILRED